MAQKGRLNKTFSVVLSGVMAASLNTPAAAWAADGSAAVDGDDSPVVLADGDGGSNPATQGEGGASDAVSSADVVAGADPQVLATAQAGSVYEITLDKDYTLADGLTVPAGVTATIDLNGHTMDMGTGVLGNHGTLTMADGVGTGKVTSALEGGSRAQGTLTNFADGTLTVSGGTYDATAHATAALVNLGVVQEISGGTFVRSNEAGYADVSGNTYNGGNSFYVVVNGDGSHSSAVIKLISDGAFEGTSGYSSMFDNYATIESITGGTFTNGFIVMKCEEYTRIGSITGGEFKAVGNNSPQAFQIYGEVGEISGSSAISAIKQGDNQSSFPAVAFNMYGEGDYAGSIGSISGDVSVSADNCFQMQATTDECPVPSVGTISGGTFTSAEGGAAVYFGGYQDMDFGPVTAGTFKGGPFAKVVEGGSVKLNTQVKGGTFDQRVDDTYLPEGSSMTQDEDGNWVVESHPVAQVGDATYASVAEAIAAAQENDTVTLLSDASESAHVIVAADKVLTLDLAGHTLDLGEYQLAVNGNLTIDDSTASQPVVSEGYEVSYEGAGKIVSANASVAVQAQLGGAVTLKRGIVEDLVGNGINAIGNQDAATHDESKTVSAVNIEGGYVHSAEYGLGVYGNQGTVNVSGGVVEAENNAVVAGNGTVNDSQNAGGTKINISGGALIGHITADGYIACGVYQPQAGDLSITGGTIYADGGVGVLVRAGNVSISDDAVITASGTTSGGVGDKGVAVAPAGVVVDFSQTAYPGSKEGTTVDISGGTISCDSSIEPVQYAKGAEVEVEPEVSVSGGSFSGSFDESLLAPGAGLVQDSEGNWAVEAKTVATIGDQEYSSLRDAFKVVQQGQTIVLAADIDVSDADVMLSGVKDVTLDLAGHTLTAENSAEGQIDVRDGAGLMLIDSTDTAENGTGKGCIKASTPYDPSVGSGIIQVSGEGTSFTMKSGLIDTVMDDAANGGQFGVTVLGKSSVTINGGKIHTGWYAISGNGSQNVGYDGTTITVNGGELISEAGQAIYHPQDGELTVNGGHIKGTTGIEMRSGRLTVNEGAVIEGGTGEFTYSPNASGSTTDNCGVVIVQHTTKLPIDVDINGGTISGTMAIAQVNPQKNPDEDVNKIEIAVNGGTFDGGIYSENFIAADGNGFINGGTFSDESVKDYVAEGFEAVEGSEGSWGVQKDDPAIFIGEKSFDTLAEAFSAAQEGDAITLTGDVTVEGQADADAKNMSGNVTLDLNGHTVYGDNDNIAIRAISNDGTLTIKNGSIKAQQGTYCTVGASAASVVLESVNLENVTANGNSVKAFAGGHVTMKNCTSASTTGGTMEATGGTIDVYDCTFTQAGYHDFASGIFAASNAGTVNVYSGTFTSENNGIYIYSSGGTVNFYGGDLKVTGSNPAVQGDISYEGATGAINISGGSITGGFEESMPEAIAVVVSGGTFSEPIDPAYLAEGYLDLSNGIEEDTVVTVAKGTQLSDDEGTPIEGAYAVQDSLDDHHEGDDDATSHPEASGMVFAGWYEDAACEKPLDESVTTGEAFAKFLDDDVLAEKRQISAGTTAASEKTNLRFVTSVDCLDYQEAGFIVNVEGRADGDGWQDGWKRFETTAVYEKIVSQFDGTIIMTNPEDFDEASQYFVTFTLTNIPQSMFGKKITVIPYWVTADGTLETGAERTLTVNDVIEMQEAAANEQM